MKSRIDLHIIQEVKRRRKQKNISQRLLAELIGTDHSFITRVENTSHPSKYSITQFYFIADFLECNIGDLCPPPNFYKPDLDSPLIGFGRDK